jgi:peptidoglycan DL-endopeptidase CwlO
MKTIIIMLLMASIAYGEEVKVFCTHYCACKKCSGDFPGKIRGQTASGKMAKEGVTIAAPKDIPFGTKIIINGHKYIVQDRGGAIKYVDGYMKIDIYVKSHKEAKKLGTYKTIVNIKR